MRVQPHTENLIVALVVAILLILTALRTLGALLHVDSTIIFGNLMQAATLCGLLIFFYWYRGFQRDIFVVAVACLGVTWWSMSPTILAIPPEAAGANVAVTLLASPMAQFAATPAVAVAIMGLFLFIATWAYAHLYS